MMPTVEAVSPAREAVQRPSRARLIVVIFAIALAVIQYIDRVAISQAAPAISKDLALSKEQMGWVFGAFTLAYALFEIPTGYMGDRIGARRVLLRVVLWWSFFTAATGWVWNWLSLVVTRFLFGAGEAGCFPNLTNAFNRWLPRGRTAPRAGRALDECALGRRRHARISRTSCCRSCRGGWRSFSSASWVSCGRSSSTPGIAIAPRTIGA